MTITQKISVLADIKSKISALYNEKKIIEAEVFDELKKEKLNSVKTDNASATIAHRKTLVITSESEAIKQLDEIGLKHEYVREMLDEKRYTNFAKEMVKQGKEVKGVDFQESEYLLVKKIDKEK